MRTLCMVIEGEGAKTVLVRSDYFSRASNFIACCFTLHAVNILNFSELAKGLEEKVL